MIDASFCQALTDGLRHAARGVPHRVVEDHRPLLRHLSGPLAILVHDLKRVVSPDDAVARRNHVHRQTQRQHFLNLALHAGTERRQDVRIVLECLFVQLVLVDLIVEAKSGGIMLAEGVVWHQDGVASQIGEHAVRPVEEARFDKDQLPGPEVDAVASVHDLVLPWLVIVPRETVNAHLGDNQLGIGCLVQDGAQTAGVIGFGMVGDHIVDASRVDDLAHVGQELVRERLPDRIDQGDLLVDDQVGVVGRAALC